MILSPTTPLSALRSAWRRRRAFLRSSSGVYATGFQSFPEQPFVPPMYFTPHPLYIVALCSARKDPSSVAGVGGFITAIVCVGSNGANTRNVPSSDSAVSLCRLIFAGKQMNDEKVAKEYNIEGGSVLHLVRRLFPPSPISTCASFGAV